MNTLDQQCVNTIRGLGIDMIQKANSGHPGIVLGAAPMAYTTWAKAMNHHPAHTDWLNRDRFVLSAGHGSALLYGLLHLFGYDLPLSELINFRQMGSYAPGHPEFGHTPGVETTTGPLGQGIANAVGFATAQAHMAAVYNRAGFDIIDHYTYVLCGDGCMMEGIASEASTLAGTLKLGKLILLYDSNHISIEGDTATAFDENVAGRYRAYGWQVLEVEDGNDLEAIEKALRDARENTDQPSLIIVTTQIGYGSPKEGSASSHGEALGIDNVAATKAKLGLGKEDFHVPQEVYKAMEDYRMKADRTYEAWSKLYEDYQKAHPELAGQLESRLRGELVDFENMTDFWDFSSTSEATRTASGTTLNRMAQSMEHFFFGGSADLGSSNKSVMMNTDYFSADNPLGGNIHFGVREHAMAAIANAIAIYGGMHAYAATFMVFCDYMKHAMRLSAMMSLPVTYILTHDSIGVGEDGPTHQPIEHITMLRSIPGMTVFRPADSMETCAAWLYAMNKKGPTSLILTRQNIPSLGGDVGKQAAKGGYVIAQGGDAPDIIMMASGSEVELTLKARDILEAEGIQSRVVSMPSWDVFAEQSITYKESVLPANQRCRLAVEASDALGWERYVGLDGDIVCMPGYGVSAPANQVFERFGFTAQNIAMRAKALIVKHRGQSMEEM